VMRAGRLVGEFSGDQLTEMAIGAAALGAAHAHDGAHGGAHGGER
jgi:hypothetical protein